MPRKKVTTAEAQAGLQLSLDTEARGNNPANREIETYAYAWVDSANVIQFPILEGIVKYFDVKVPTDMSEVEIWRPPSGAITYPGDTTSPPEENANISSPRPRVGISIARKNKRIMGKLIKLPTSAPITMGTNDSRSKKLLYCRIPQILSMTAVAYWIQTCFNDTAKRPTWFISPGGSRVTITGTINKADLGNLRDG